MITTSLIEVEISTRAAEQFRQGNLWVYSNEVRMKKPFPPAGSWCLFRTKEKGVGTGYFNPHSLIAGRIVSEGRRNDVEALLAERLEAAFELRARFSSNGSGSLLERGSVRLVFSEADLIPGLVLDWYSGVLVLQSNTAGIDQVLGTLEKLVPRIFKKVFALEAEALVVRGDSSIRKLEGLPEFTRVVLGEESRLADGSFSEGEVRYAANFTDGQKTGFFLDHGANRSHFKELIAKEKPASALDLFCYSGGWGLGALKKGAGKVTFVDESREALQLAEKGLALNGISTDKARFVKSGVFDLLEKEQTTYDVIVADPPAFAKSKKDLPQAIKAYEKLNRLCWWRLNKGGLLVSSSCSYHLSEEDFLSVLKRAVGKEGSRAHVIYRGGQGPDHPVLLSMPETNYLKCVFLRKL